jgi:hypothetical protein
MANWSKDTAAAKNAFYGNFKVASFQAEHLTRIKLRFMIYRDKNPMKTGILVNKAGFDECGTLAPQPRLIA